MRSRTGWPTIQKLASPDVEVSGTGVVPSSLRLALRIGRCRISKPEKRHRKLHTDTRVRFFLDPTLSDAELAKAIMEIAREHFPQFRGSESPEFAEET